MEKKIRKEILDLVYKSGDGHIPSAFSIVEIVEYLYENMKFNAKRPNWSERDYFILSKAHGCAALYVILKNHRFITQHDLDNKGKPGAILGGQPDRISIPGVEANTGSLGHGLANGIGIALGLKILGKKNKVIVLVGDGECNEGTIWEGALVASHLKLGNLCVFVDDNKSSWEVLPMRWLTDKWEAFGWDVYKVNGHNKKEIDNVYKGLDFSNFIPKVVIADTVKGKGVKRMESNSEWHYKVPNKKEFKEIHKELNEATVC